MAMLFDGQQSPEAAAASISPLAGSMPPGSVSSMDIEAMACELLASGYLVQVRDGAQQQERTKSTRSCLQNLRHRFIVCLGWRSRADAEPEYLPEPLVVEPRFRDQFAIAHPTALYESLLQVGGSPNRRESQQNPLLQVYVPCLHIWVFYQHARPCIARIPVVAKELGYVSTCPRCFCCRQCQHALLALSVTWRLS